MVKRISVGAVLPKDFKFTYIPWTAQQAGLWACGAPIELNLKKEVPGKKLLIVAVPGAFTPTCMNYHIPGYGERIDEIRSKGVDEVIIISTNDPFVMSAWGKILELSNRFKFACDPNAAFSQKIGLCIDGNNAGLGVRTQRYALVVDNGIVTYVGVEPVPSEVSVSGVDAVLAHLNGK